MSEVAPVDFLDTVEVVLSQIKDAFQWNHDMDGILIRLEALF